jgi:DNA-directed RNA polymerase specialized sigma24 family protein
VSLQLIHQVLRAKSGSGSLREVASCLRLFMHKQILSFTKDRALMRIESYDSLTNICLLKLHRAICDFAYDAHLSELHNQRRFMSMVKKYLRNILLDCQSAANLPVRKPKHKMFSLDDGTDSETGLLPDKRTHTQFDYASADDIEQRLLALCNDEERYIVKCLLQRYTPEETAQHVGCSASRVRYLVYNKIQPKLSGLVATG